MTLQLVKVAMTLPTNGAGIWLELVGGRVNLLLTDRVCTDATAEEETHCSATDRLVIN